MKAKIILMLTAILIFSSCSKDDDPILEPQVQRDEIPFTGVWQRQFEPIPSSLHTAKYFIYQDSIRYTLTGNLGQANYVMKRDTFLLENKRFIGHTNANQHYLIFVKYVNNDSIALYKQEVANVAEGMTIEVPDDTTIANHGWNTYYKQ